MDAGADVSVVGTGGKYKDKRPVDLLNSTYVLLLSIREHFANNYICRAHQSFRDLLYPTPNQHHRMLIHHILWRFSFYSSVLAATPHEVTPAVTPSKPTAAGRICCIDFVLSYSFSPFSLSATPLFTDPAELDPRLQVS
jgi:hypothetical protein